MAVALGMPGDGWHGQDQFVFNQVSGPDQGCLQQQRIVLIRQQAGGVEASHDGQSESRLHLEVVGLSATLATQAKGGTEGADDQVPLLFIALETQRVADLSAAVPVGLDQTTEPSECREWQVAPKFRPDGDRPAGVE